MEAPGSIKVLSLLDIVVGGGKLAIIVLVLASRGGTDTSGWIFMGAISAFLVTMIVTGFFLRRGSRLARHVETVLCALRLIGFPIGTIWGVFGLYALFNQEGERFFSGLPPEQHADECPPLSQPAPN